MEGMQQRRSMLVHNGLKVQRFGRQFQCENGGEEKDKFSLKTFSRPSPVMHMGGFPTLQI
jgi:hypothetical protein